MPWHRTNRSRGVSYEDEASITRSPNNDIASGSSGSRLPVLIVGAIGVVYGDIGTSPLYTMREAFGLGGLPLGEEAILGVLSLVFWALLIVVTIKYVAVIMRADNQGQGGVLALATLALRGLRAGGRRQQAAVVLAMIGAALFYGDGIITPAISVLSAVEGLEVATPPFEPYVVPIAIAILVGLFLVQRRGTGGVGKLFGPIMRLVCHAGRARPLADPRGSERSAGAQPDPRCHFV
jgi:KUP system potassium uptake protein